jgi:hypothetical protein
MTIRRLPQPLGLCCVAALGIFLIVACTSPPASPPAAPSLLSLEIPSDAHGGGFSGVTPAVVATATSPANYFVLPLLPPTAPIARVVLELPANSVLSVTASDLSSGLTAPLPLPITSPPGPNSPGPTTGYVFLNSVTSNSSTFYVRYPNSFQGSKAIRTTLTDSVGGVASAPLTFDMSFRGSTVTVAIATENNDGRVTSNPPGIDCPGTCTADFLTSTSVQLTQSVSHNQTEFIGWTGSCSGAGPCTVQLLAPGPVSIPANPAVTANFRIHTNAAAGVEEITLSRSTDPGDDQFVYKNPLNLFIPAGALVLSVTNVSSDVNGNGVKLDLVRHTGANGSPRSLPAANGCTAPLEPQASTSTFNGLTVEGEWKVHVVCTSQVFLNSPPARIALQIVWTQ